MISEKAVHVALYPVAEQETFVPGMFDEQVHPTGKARAQKARRTWAAESRDVYITVSRFKVDELDLFLQLRAALNRQEEYSILVVDSGGDRSELLDGSILVGQNRDKSLPILKAQTTVSVSLVDSGFSVFTPQGVFLRLIRC